MVVIPGGTFRMGDIQNRGEEVERPVHRVKIRSFAIGRYEVTFAEYDVFAKATGRSLPEDEGWGRAQRPVINVSWHDADAYAKWLSAQTGASYRLPSEAEWEYMARGGEETAYWWGNSLGRNRANCGPCGSQWDEHTAPVGSFKPNPFGVHDTVGNVLEWVQDCWHDSYAGAPADGTAWLEANGGDCRERVQRGGNWAFDREGVRSAYRVGIDTPARAKYTGFRLARDIN